MVHAGCIFYFIIFFVGIHPSRTCVSGSFESVLWNACVHRLNLGSYSHPKEFLGNGVRFNVNSKGKPPLPEAQRRIEPVMLHHKGQRTQHTTYWTILAPPSRVTLGTSTFVLLPGTGVAGSVLELVTVYLWLGEIASLMYNCYLCGIAVWSDPSLRYTVHVAGNTWCHG